MTGTEWIEIGKVVADVVKGLAWPIVALVVTFIFKKDLRTLFDRLRKASLSAVEFEHRIQTSGGANEPAAITQQFSNVPAVDALARELDQNLKLVEDSKQKPLLLMMLAEARYLAIFERIYATIFGSQISGLRALIESGGTVNVQEAQNFFDGIREKYPEVHGTRTLNDWLQYLAINKLIDLHGDEVRITEIGKMFVNYLITTGRTEITRPF